MSNEAFSEIRKNKCLLEAQISESLLKFQNDNDVEISNISINECLKTNKGFTVFEADIEIKI